MRIALGVLDPDAGEVLWQGRPARREEQHGFGYMPEERGLYPKMRADRQLRYLAVLVPLGARIYERSVLRMGKPMKPREAWRDARA